MKNKKLYCILAVAVVVIFASVVCSICLLPKPNPSPLKSYKQNLNYTESIEKINNPDQGFYRPIYVKANEDGISYNKNIVTSATQLYHLRVDISEFSGMVNGSQDKPLSSAMLTGLDQMLTYLQQQNKNAIVRFAYDPSYGGAKDKEPSQEMIETHITQVCQVLNNYTATITAIEAGLIGPWGEMHSSTIANSAHIVPIIQTFLNNTTELPLLVRTPKMIYDYLGITLSDIGDYNISQNSNAYRLGLYNDGYLGSDTDLGTYTNRAAEVEFLSKLTSHLPYGGEVVIPSSPLHNIDVCLPEMNKLNLSYLNIEWNYQVIDKWKDSQYTSQCGQDSPYYGQSAFTYIENHLGYRFVLTNSVFEYSNKYDRLNIKLSLKNVGFGNLNKQKQCKLMFVGDHGEVKYTAKVQNFNGEATLNYSTSLNLQNGKYSVYLCMYGQQVDGNAAYYLQLANNNIYNASLCANKIGEINVQK